MKKNHKKKFLAIAIVMILLSIGIVSGSLAWFTATDQVTNVFTVGSIEVAQRETDETGAAFQQNQMLLPIVGESSIQEDPHFIHKIVTVENTGENPAFVRTWVALPTQLEGILCYVDNNTDWQRQPNKITHILDGVSYSTWCYVYQNPLAAESATEPLLKGVYLAHNAELQDNPATASTNLEFCLRQPDESLIFSGYEILDAHGNLLNGKVVDLIIATQAVQTEGFTQPGEALNTAFAQPTSAASVPFFQNP